MGMPLRAMTLGFVPVCEIDRYHSLQVTRSWVGIGKLEIKVSKYVKDVDKLVRGMIVFPHKFLNKAYVIRHKEIELDDLGKPTENWVITALSLKSWMEQRVTMPPEGLSNDAINAPAETVMKHYITQNVISPVDQKRRMENIVLEPDLGRGEVIEWSSRYRVLAEEQEAIGLMAKIGWNIIPDIEAKQFVFSVDESKDLTASQNILPPAIFSPELNSLNEMSYTESDMDFKNYAIIAGQGEGVDRRIITIGDSVGFDRHELFVDARDVEEEKEGVNGGEPTPRPIEDIERDLTNRGNKKLSEHQHELFLEGKISEKSHLIYEKDYELGDIVTLQNRSWGITLDTPITEVKEIYEEKGKVVEITFGENIPTFIDKVKREMNTFKNEINR